jgi:hypothetical protein
MAPAALPAPRFRIIKRTQAEAIARLKQLYAEGCERYPTTCEIPEALYVRVNLRPAMRYAVPIA